ncbi:Gfo/Idh/MocA family oxidoreductase [Actinoplanes missouriensis]|uniref:Gfo/Idh/MocA family protein n=1 Tax=Actinoplanes missouriensis TaxID=1866 RepID=UPI003406541B
MNAAGRLRIGLIGTGRWGSRYLATIGRLWTASEVVVSDTAGRGGSGPPGLVRWPSPAALVASARVDGIIVASPASTHEPIVTGILNRGIPVLVEKPLTPDLPGTVRLRSHARRTGTPVLVGHQHLRAPAYQELRRLVRGRAIDEIRGVAGGNGPIRADCTALWDYGPHDLAMVLDLVGAVPVTVRHAGCRVHGPGSEEWTADLRAGATAVRLDLSNTVEEKTHRLSVTTTDGDSLVYDDFAGHRLRVNGVPVEVSGELPLDRQVREFVATIRGAPGGTTPDDLDLAVAIARILQDISDAAVLSSRSPR